MDETLFLGHKMSYWLELQKRIIEEIAELKGRLAFIESRIKEMNTVLNK